MTSVHYDTYFRGKVVSIGERAVKVGGNRTQFLVSMDEPIDDGEGLTVVLETHDIGTDRCPRREATQKNRSLRTGLTQLCRRCLGENWNVKHLPVI